MAESVETKRIYVEFGVRNGVFNGIFCGLFGGLIFAIVAARKTSERLFETFRKLVVRVAAGQISGVITTALAFSTFKLTEAQLSGLPISIKKYSDGYLLLLLATILMICGAIAGAIFKRD